MMLKRRAQKNEEIVSTQPHLNTRLLQDFPFEHEIVPFEQLHPELQWEITEIQNYAAGTKAAWRFAILMSLMETLNLSQPFLVMSNGISQIINNNITSAKANERARRIEDYQFDLQKLATVTEKSILWSKMALAAVLLKLPISLSQSNDDSRNLPTLVFTLAYFGTVSSAINIWRSQKQTVDLSKLISSLSEEKSAPFRREDCAQLLRDFHYGFIDNNGSIVLIKHPENDHKHLDSSWLEKKFHTLLMQTPLLRTRFEVNPPTQTEKDSVLDKLRSTIKRSAPSPL